MVVRFRERECGGKLLVQIFVCFVCEASRIAARRVQLQKVDCHFFKIAFDFGLDLFKLRTAETAQTRRAFPSAVLAQHIRIFHRNINGFAVAEKQLDKILGAEAARESVNAVAKTYPVHLVNRVVAFFQRKKNLVAFFGKFAGVLSDGLGKYVVAADKGDFVGVAYKASRKARGYNRVFAKLVRLF